MQGIRDIFAGFRFPGCVAGADEHMLRRFDITGGAGKTPVRFLFSAAKKHVPSRQHVVAEFRYGEARACLETGERFLHALPEDRVEKRPVPLVSRADPLGQGLCIEFQADVPTEF